MKIILLNGVRVQDGGTERMIMSECRTSLAGKLCKGYFNKKVGW